MLLCPVQWLALRDYLKILHSPAREGWNSEASDLWGLKWYDSSCKMPSSSSSVSSLCRTGFEGCACCFFNSSFFLSDAHIFLPLPRVLMNTMTRRMVKSMVCSHRGNITLNITPAQSSAVVYNSLKSAQWCQTHVFSNYAYMQANL